jgi:hypothetical protein
MITEFFYDDEYDFELVKITSTVLATQNNYGGYGVMPNSSACEDIDSLDLLLIFLPKVSMDAQAAILTSIKNGLNWVLINQVEIMSLLFLSDLLYDFLLVLNFTFVGCLLPNMANLVVSGHTFVVGFILS